LTFFRVLPTDPRYLNLNLFQKFVLLSQIGKHKEYKFNLTNGMLNQLKMYINPILFKQECDSINDTIKPYERVNKDFAKQATSGRMTGHVKLSSDMEAGINAYNEARKDPNRQFLSVSQNVQAPTPQNKDDEELG
jgi:hypothetical protein